MTCVIVLGMIVTIALLVFVYIGTTENYWFINEQLQENLNIEYISVSQWGPKKNRVYAIKEFHVKFVFHNYEQAVYFTREDLESKHFDYDSGVFTGLDDDAVKKQITLFPDSIISDVSWKRIKEICMEFEKRQKK